MCECFRGIVLCNSIELNNIKKNKLGRLQAKVAVSNVGCLQTG